MRHGVMTLVDDSLCINEYEEKYDKDAMLCIMGDGRATVVACDVRPLMIYE